MTDAIPNDGAPSRKPPDARVAQDQRLTGLTRLLQLQQEARQAATPTALGFVMVNETGRLVRYRQAILWRVAAGRQAAGRAVVMAASAVPTIDRDAPFVRAVQRLATALLRAEDGAAAGPRSVDDLSDKAADLQQEWREWFPAGIFWQPLKAPDGSILGGLILLRDDVWTDGDATLLARAADAYGHAWAALIPRRQYRVRGWFRRRRLWLALLVLIVAAMFMPVRQSVVAPAVVVARGAIVVAAPLRGVVQSVAVAPNQRVKAGQILFRLDDTEIKSQYEVAEKAWRVAQADVQRAAQRSFVDADSKARLALLQNRAALRKAEMVFQKRLLARSVVRAPRAGLAVFSDANDWVGKPVVLGEKVMTIADAHDTWLEVWVPIDDAIAVEPGAAIRFFLNVDPLSPVDATVRQTSFVAEPSPADIISYRLKANFAPGVTRPRLGLKGTAKIYGQRTTLFYFLFRRPLAAVRRMLGL